MLAGEHFLKGGFRGGFALEDQQHAFHGKVRRDFAAIVDGRSQRVAIAFEDDKRGFIDRSNAA